MQDSDKKARLAEALRANLRKRKAQAREQSADVRPAEASPGEPDGDRSDG